MGRRRSRSSRHHSAAPFRARVRWLPARPHAPPPRRPERLPGGWRLRQARNMRVLLRLILTLLIVAALAMTIERLLENRDRREHPLRGVLVDAGGFRLRMIASGAGMPGPTVLLETGIGGATAATWAWEQRGVETFAPVVSYDRAGLGDSEPGPMPRDGRRLVEELHRALASAGLQPPYV